MPMTVSCAPETEEGRELTEFRSLIGVCEGPVRVRDLGAVDEEPAQVRVLPYQRVQQLLNGAACLLVRGARVAERSLRSVFNAGCSLRSLASLSLICFANKESARRSLLVIIRALSWVLLALIIHESGGLGCLGPRKGPSDLRRCVSVMNASASSGGHLRGET